MATPSIAADLPRPVDKAPYKNSPVYVPPFSWTGFYVGINGGYGWGKSNWTVPGTGDFDLKGGLIGGTPVIAKSFDLKTHTAFLGLAKKF